MTPAELDGHLRRLDGHLARERFVDGRQRDRDEIRIQVGLRLAALLRRAGRADRRLRPSGA